MNNCDNCKCKFTLSEGEEVCIKNKCVVFEQNKDRFFDAVDFGLTENEYSTLCEALEKIGGK